jgi:hypothetical protein
MRYTGPPMTLGNMRANGVHTIAAYCQRIDCHHSARVDVSILSDEIDVPAGGVCGARPADCSARRAGRTGTRRRRDGRFADPGHRPIRSPTVMPDGRGHEVSKCGLRNSRSEKLRFPFSFGAKPQSRSDSSPTHSATTTTLRY